MKEEIKKWEHLPRRKKWFERRKLKLRSMGITNRAYDKSNKKSYSVQFYDYDIDGKAPELLKEDINRILRIFPYDCLMYETKHGIHFISFALTYGYRKTKARAIEVSKLLGNQDYWTSGKSLVLRVSPKWKVNKVSKKRKVISEKPRFKGLIKKPHGYRISNKHLEFYKKYMNLPNWVYKLYDDCHKFEYQMGIVHYKTRD